MKDPVSREAVELAQFLPPVLIAGLLGLALPIMVRPLLMRWGIMDVPSQRSSHTVPTVRGMGLAMAMATVIALAITFAMGSIQVDRSVFLVAMAGMVLSGLLGWAEDYRGQPVGRRALLQLLIGAVVSTAFTLAIGTSIWWIPMGTLAIAAYINVVNFMDGLNGISGMHGLTVGLAYAYAGWVTELHWLVACGAALAAAYLAFLPWNFTGRRVFLGDTGSYFLGGAIACCAVGAFLSDIYVEYLLSPLLIYLSDTGVTLLRRIYRGEPWYQPHRQHVYQRLTDLGFSHLGSSLTVTAATAAVTAISVLSLPFEPEGTAGMGVMVVVIIVVYLSLPWLIAQLRSSTSPDA